MGIQLMSTDYEQRFGAPKNEFAKRRLFYEVESGEFEQSVHGERTVLTAFRVSSLYPLAVVTHIQRDYALSQWETETKTILGIVVPTLLIVSLLSISRYRRQQLLVAKTNESNRLQQMNAARVFTNSHEGIMMCAADGSILDVNDAFTRITGFGRRILGKNPRILRSWAADQRVLCRPLARFKRVRFLERRAMESSQKWRNLCRDVDH